MRFLTKKRLFILKHYDFLLVDFIAFVLGYLVSLLFRRSLEIRLYNQDLLWTYGIVAVSSFVVVELLSENLKGVITRGLVRETQVVTLQMTITWTVYLSVLYFMHNIHYLSRIFAATSFLFCWIFLLVFRNGWKMVCKFSKRSDEAMPELLIVSEASRAQEVLNRLLPGELSREYEIRAVVTNEKGEPDYHDWYPLETGLEKVYDFLGERRLQYAYVELEDKQEEKDIIDQFLKVGIIVYRSLGDSVLQYAEQTIAELNGKTVIMISGAETSLASKADQALKRLKQRMFREKE